jgi:tripartite-type tricarboxylate transporter receptor subunit TctC
MLLHPAVPAKTVREFIAYARSNPGKLNYGSSGPGSSPHLATELLMSMSGIRMTHIPYKGVAPAITALLGNEVQLAFSNLFSTEGHWKSGRLRLVAHSGSKRLQALPEVPTIAESGVPGFEALIWYGYMGPAKLPRAIVERLNREIAAIANLPDVHQTLVAQGNEVIAGSPEAFAKLVVDDANKWGAIGKKLGVRLD